MMDSTTNRRSSVGNENDNSEHLSSNNNNNNHSTPVLTVTAPNSPHLRQRQHQRTGSLTLHNRIVASDFDNHFPTSAHNSSALASNNININSSSNSHALDLSRNEIMMNIMASHFDWRKRFDANADWFKIPEDDAVIEVTRNEFPIGKRNLAEVSANINTVLYGKQQQQQQQSSSSGNSNNNNNNCGAAGTPALPLHVEECLRVLYGQWKVFRRNHATLEYDRSVRPVTHKRRPSSSSSNNNSDTHESQQQQQQQEEAYNNHPLYQPKENYHFDNETQQMYLGSLSRNPAASAAVAAATTTIASEKLKASTQKAKQQATTQTAGAGAQLQAAVEKADQQQVDTTPKHDRRDSSSSKGNARIIPEDELSNIQPLPVDYSPSVDDAKLQKNASMKARLLTLYEPSYEWCSAEVKNCARTDTPPYPLRTANHVIISFNSIDFNTTTPLEPLFCRAALYDRKFRKKVSQDFHFHLNSQAELDLFLESRVAKEFELERFARGDAGALFTLPEDIQHEELYLVVMIDRLLSGSTDDAYKVYSQLNTSNMSQSLAAKADKKKQKYRTLTQEVTTCTGYFLQPFLIGHMPVFFDSSDGNNMFAGAGVGAGAGAASAKQTNKRKLVLREGLNVITEVYKMAGDGGLPFDALDYLDSLGTLPSSGADGYGGSADQTSISSQAHIPIYNNKELKSLPCKIQLEIISASPEKMPMLASRKNLLSATSDTGSEASSNKRLLDALTKYHGNLSGRYSMVEKLMSMFRTIDFIPLTIPTTPYLSFVNCVYVYPMRVNFTALPSNIKCDNIAIRITFRAKDDITFSSLRKIAHKYCDTASEKYWTTTVTFGEDCKKRFPQFTDEIKIDLPLPIQRKHHVLFEFFSISMLSKKPPAKKLLNPLAPQPLASSGQIRRRGTSFMSSATNEQAPDMIPQDANLTRIGYSFLPLYWNNGYIPNQTHELPVFANLRDGYIDADIQAHCTKHAAGKCVFEVKTNTISSVYPHEPIVNDFLSKASSVLTALTQLRDEIHNNPSGCSTTDISAEHNKLFKEELSALIKTMEHIKQANFTAVLPHFPHIINIIFKLMVTITDLLPNLDPEVLKSQSLWTRQFTESLETMKKVQSVQATSFATILFLLKGCSRVLKESGRKHTVLSSYVQYLFDNINASKKFYSILITQWNVFIADNQEEHAAEHNELSRRYTQVSITDTLEYCWFFFDLIHKSIALYTAPHTDGKVEVPDSVRQEVYEDKYFVDEMKHLLSHFVRIQQELLTKTHRRMKQQQNNSTDADAEGTESKDDSVFINEEMIAKRANVQLALFLRDLIPVQKTSHVIEIMMTYLQLISQLGGDPAEEPDKVSNSTVMRLLLDFFEVFMDYEHIECVAANPPAGSKSVAHLLIELVHNAIKSNDQVLTAKALQILRSHLTKIDYDVRYKDPAGREHLALIYFPFVQMLIEDKEVLDLIQDETALCDCIVSALFIMLNASKIDMTNWLISQGFTPLYNLFEVFTLAIVAFRHHPADLKSTISIAIMDMFDLFMKCFKTHKLPATLKMNQLKTGDSGSPIAESAAVPTGRKSSVKATPPPPPPPAHGILSIDEVLQLVDRCSQFLMNFLLSPQENHIMATFFAKVLPPFIRDYFDIMTTFKTIKLSQVDQMNSTAALERRNFPGWRWILGAVLIHCDMPTMKYTHKYIALCLRELLKPFASLSVPLSRKEFVPEILTSPRASADDVDAVVASSSGDHDTTATTTTTNKPKIDHIIEDGELKGASLEKLVEWLAHSDSDKRIPAVFQHTFFLTYRSFTTPEELLQKLIERFRIVIADKKDSAVRSIRLGNAIRYWIRENFDDFDSKLITDMLAFLDGEFSEASAIMKKTALQFKTDIQKKLLEVRLLKVTSFIRPPPEPLLPPNFVERKLHVPKTIITTQEFMEWPALEIARQMTLIEYSLYKAIQPRELFKLAWLKKNRYELAPNVSMIADRFNRVSDWIKTMIIKVAELKHRKSLIAKLIELCEHLYELKNFCSLNQVLSALNCASVARLKRTWELLNRENPSLYLKREELTELMRHPYHRLNEVMSTIITPCVPFIGMFLTMLYFIEENNDFIRFAVDNNRSSSSSSHSNSNNDNGNNDSNSNSNEEEEGVVVMINFKKRSMYADLIQKVQEFQHKPFELQPVPYLQNLLLLGGSSSPPTAVEIYDEDKLYNVSLQLEPRST